MTLDRDAPFDNQQMLSLIEDMTIYIEKDENKENEIPN